MSFPFLFSHLFWFHFTCHISHKSGILFWKDWGHRQIVCMYSSVSEFSDSEELGYASELCGPEALYWLTRGSGARRLLLQITHETPIYVKSVINEQHWVLIPWVYFSIKCLDNRCLWYTFTNNASARGWPILVPLWYSQTSLAQALHRTAQFHLAFGLWVQTFLFITEHGCEDRSCKWLSYDPLSLGCLF